MPVMAANRVVPVLSLIILALAALLFLLGEKKNQSFDGVIVLNGMTYEFYPNAKACNHRGTPYVLLPNARFGETVTTGSTDLEHLGGLFHGTWRAKLNGNLSRIGLYKYNKTYWRQLSVNFVVDAVPIKCGDTQCGS